jgi:YcxB-like protein
MIEHTVKYTTTKAHLIYFSFYHTLRQNPVRIMFAIPIIFLAWRLSVFADTHQFPLYMKIAIVVAGVFAIILFILGLHLVMSLLIHAGTTKNSGILTTHTVKLTDSGISEDTPAGHSEQNWKSIVEVQRTQNFILIYTQRHAAHLIPLSAFASRQAADEFYNFAQSSLEKAM